MTPLSNQINIISLVAFLISFLVVFLIVVVFVVLFLFLFFFILFQVALACGDGKEKCKRGFSGIENAKGDEKYCFG